MIAIDPVLQSLADLDVLTPADIDYLRRHGRSYRGVKLPHEIEPWPRYRCLDAADALEEDGHGRFVRGFALRPGSHVPLMHAWVSPDGRTVVDAVWTEQDRCSYWGLDRKHEAVLERMTALVVREIETRARPSWWSGVFGSLP